MTAAVIYSATCGTVTAQVMRTAGRCCDEYAILIQGNGTLVEHDQVHRQAEMFIAYQEQLARMAWCASCGG